MPFIALAVGGSLLASAVTTGVLFSTSALLLAAPAGGIYVSNLGAK